MLFIEILSVYLSLSEEGEQEAKLHRCLPLAGHPDMHVLLEWAVKKAYI